MRQLLFILFVFITHISTSYANDDHSYDNTAWNVIRERLFNGENTKAFRFEEDIRFQVIGAKTHQDSAVFTKMIAELNELMEIVQIKLVDEKPNYRVTIHYEEGTSSSVSQVPSGSSIKKVYLHLRLPKSLQDKKTINKIYFKVIRNLTTLYPNTKDRKTYYGGIYDPTSNFREGDVEFHFVDKEILKELYSYNFYKRLKYWMVNEYSYESYLHLRYEKLIAEFSFWLKIVVILFGFLFLLSKESKRKQNPNLILYIKQRVVILLILPFFFSSIESDNLFIFLVSYTIAFLINYVLIVLISICVLIAIYYVDKIKLKKQSSLAAKQVLIFFSSIIVINIISLVSIFILRLIGFHLSLENYFHISISHFWNLNFTWQSLVVFIAALRVFYNIIQYRIQSMVNKKDVEIAKMKELKNQAELNALHSRINPHFLYNSLNSIASLAHMDAHKTEHMATGLSELFRYSINKENKTFVAVAEELEMVKKYLEIEKTRFGERLVYEINADESVLEKQIPKFMIQPLVENAIKHGLSKIKEAGKVTVELKQDNKDMIIAVYDNGPDFPTEPVSGYGLQNLYDKLDIIYGDTAGINWENGSNKHLKITLKNQFQ